MNSLIASTNITANLDGHHFGRTVAHAANLSLNEI